MALTTNDRGCSSASLSNVPVALGLPVLFVLAAAFGAGAVRRAG